MDMMNLNCTQRPHFKAFRIEGPSSKETGKFGGTEKFLFDETNLIDRAKKEINDPKFESPMDKIFGLIKRQEKNPYDIVLSSKESKRVSGSDHIMLSLKNPEGKTMLEREVYNSVHTIEQDGKKPQIMSLFFLSLDYFEKLANDLHQRNS